VLPGAYQENALRLGLRRPLTAGAGNETRPPAVQRRGETARWEAGVRRRDKIEAEKAGEQIPKANGDRIFWRERWDLCRRKRPVRLELLKKKKLLAGSVTNE